MRVVHLPESTHARVKKFCGDRGIKIGTFVEGVITEAIHGRPHPATPAIGSLLTAVQTLDRLARGRVVLMRQVDRSALSTLTMGRMLSRIGDRLVLRRWPAELVRICCGK